MDGEFSFTAAELDRGGKRYSFTLEHAWLQRALEARKPDPEIVAEASGQAPAELEDIQAGAGNGAVLVRASRSDKEVVVHGTASASLRVTCARCTTPFELDVSAELSALFVPKSKLKAEAAEVEFSSGEAEIEAFDGETVILDDLILDALLLEIPMIPLCSEECPGMSAPPSDAQAEEPTIDPRLLPLLRFKGSA